MSVVIAAETMRGRAMADWPIIGWCTTHNEKRFKSSMICWSVARNHDEGLCEFVDRYLIPTDKVLDDRLPRQSGPMWVEAGQRVLIVEDNDD